MIKKLEKNMKHFYMDESSILGDFRWKATEKKLPQEDEENLDNIANYYIGYVEESFITLYLSRLNSLFPDFEIIEIK